jgi:hypothetical protein
MRVRCGGCGAGARLLEALNSVLVAFVATELLLVRSRADRPALRRVAVVAVASNVLLSETSRSVASIVSAEVALALSWASAGVAAAVHGLAAPVRWLFALGGSTLLASLAATAAVALVAAGCVLQRGRTRFTAREGAALAAFATLFFIVMSAAFPTALAHMHDEATRVLIGLALFTTLCYYDVRRFHDDITLNDFAR